MKSYQTLVLILAGLGFSFYAHAELPGITPDSDTCDCLIGQKSKSEQVVTGFAASVLCPGYAQPVKITVNLVCKENSECTKYEFGGTRFKGPSNLKSVLGSYVQKGDIQCESVESK